MNTVPPVAVLIRHTCADFDRWKAAFDADEPARKAAGMVGHHINRGRENPNEVTVFIAASDQARAQAFATSPALKATMQAAGVTSAPEITWVTPVSEHIVWDRTLPAMMIRHTVADFATWQAGYAKAAPIRTTAGVIGHAVNRSHANPNEVVVYHQAETPEALSAFAANPELKGAMQAAGVTSAPTFTFVTGGWGKQY